MKVNVHAVGTALAAATMMVAVPAAPAAASTRSSAVKVSHDVRAADRALMQLRKLSSSNPVAARRALVRVRTDMTAASQQARTLRSGTSSSTAATAFESVAVQYNLEIQTLTGLVTSTSGALQTSLANALVPALAAQTQVIASLVQLTSTLSASAAETAVGTITKVIGDEAGEIVALTNLVTIGDALPSTVEQLVAQAVATAGGAIDTNVSELEHILPTLPADVQAAAQTLITPLGEGLAQVQATLQGATGALGGMMGGTVGTELSQVTSILQEILGDLPALGGTATGGTGTVSVGIGTGSSTGAVGTTTTVTGTTGVPAFFGTLLAHLGMILPVM